MTFLLSRPTRRGFLQTAGAAIAAPWVVPAFGAAPPPSARINTALIGSGSRGQQIMAGGDRVIAVCDVDAKHREAAKAKIDALVGNQDCKAYSDFREVLARDDIDAVVVAAPDHWHVPIALAAVRAGKAAFVEKPMTLSIREGRILAEAVRRHGTILQVGSQQRSDANFLKACELVRNGRIGELKAIQVEIPTRGGKSGKVEPWSPQPVPPELDYEMWLGPAPWAPYHVDRCHYNFRFVSDYSGGDVTNWGAHQVDIAQWALGADDSGPVAVEGRGQRNPTGLYDVFFEVEIDYTYANGVKVLLRSGGNFVRFLGSDGWIYVSRGKIDAEPRTVLSSRIGPNEIHLDPQGLVAEGATHMGIWLDAIRARNSKRLNVPVEIGHRSATVCHLGNIAMELGRKLRWDPANEQFAGDEDANRMRSRPSRAPWGV